MESYQLTVEGLSCSGCEERVETAIGQVDGVHRVEADRDSNTVEITADGATEDAVRRTVFEAGYDVPD